MKDHSFDRRTVPWEKRRIGAEVTGRLCVLIQFKLSCASGTEPEQLAHARIRYELGEVLRAEELGFGGEALRGAGTAEIFTYVEVKKLVESLIAIEQTLSSLGILVAANISHEDFQLMDWRTFIPLAAQPFQL